MGRKEFIEHIEANGKEGKTWEELAKIYNIVSGNAARKIWKKHFNNKNNINFYQVVDSEYKETESTTTSNSNYTSYNEIIKEANLDKGTLKSTIELDFEPKDDVELAELHKVNLDKYKISTYYSKLKSNGKFTSTVLCAAKKNEDFSLEQFTKFLSTYQPNSTFYDNVTLQHSDSNEYVDVEISIADFHLDRLTLNRDSIESRVEEYISVLRSLIKAAAGAYLINKFIFVIGNDFFNTDNYQGGTTNLTPQDNSVTWNEAYEKGFDLLVQSISILGSFAKYVEVLLVQGNHARTKEYYLAHALEVYFKSDTRITFDRKHSTTKFKVLGNTFIGYHHGNTAIDQLPLLFATSPDSCKEFGNAKFRECHTADKHHYLAKEVKGVRIQQIPSMVNADRWSTDVNYLNNVRAGLAFVYHPTKGKIAEFEERI